MKTTIVPAQVTTVEDKITGNLGVSQMLLLATPVFIGSLLFVLLPPFFSYASYKVGLIAILVFLCITLSVRIKGTIVLNWVRIMAQYNIRPKYYVFNKNSMHLRQDDLVYETVEETAQQPQKANPSIKKTLPISDVVSVEQLIANPSANFKLKVSKKGRLSVYITEI
ncbi:MAG: PrgI family protein [Anaerolineae bacterium]|nr:PrgI family protein [Anaerolineae bacterium]